MNISTARATIRVARRNVLRSRWRSLLVMLLVLLPVAAMVGAIALIETTMPSAERTLTETMGQADLIAYPQSTAATEAVLRSKLPAGSRLEPELAVEDRVLARGSEIAVTRWSMNLDGLARGSLDILSGRTPQREGEVAISTSLADASAAGIGGTLTLKSGGTLAIVGILEDQLNLRSRIVLQPASVAAAASPDQVRWLVGLPAGGVFDPTSFQPSGSDGPPFLTNSRPELLYSAGEQSGALIVLGGLALVEASLVAAAAFAVSIRRRQRELGLLAAVGAEGRQIAGTVVAEALLIGGVGAIGGVVLGLCGAIAISPWLDELTNHRNPPIGIAPVWAVIAAGLGLLAALVAAAVPAWSAARLPVLTALSGRRPPSAPAHRTLVFGIVVVLVSVGITALGADYSREGRGAGVPLLLLGAVLGTLGCGATSPWLVERLGTPAARLPLSTRIALRDTARARGRSGPIVTALLAGFAATVAIAAYVASQDASAAAQWQPWLRPDQIYAVGTDAGEAGPQIARELKATAAADVPYAGNNDRWLTYSIDAPGLEHIGPTTVGSPELLRALGADEPTIAAFERGATVVFSGKPADVSRATILAMTAPPPAAGPEPTGGGSVGVELGRVETPARVVITDVTTGDLPGVVVPPAVASQLGVETRSSGRYLIRLGHKVTDGEFSAASSIAGRLPDAYVTADFGPSRPGDGFRTFALVASLLLALSITGVAVALGEAESRPQQRTLLALGAEPRLRRRIAAARAGVISLIAGALAIPAGLLPVWGLLASRSAPLVVPLPEVAVGVAVLPAIAIVATLLLARPLPQWSAFRDPRV